MKLRDYLAAERGRCARVGRVSGLAAAYVHQIASGRRPASPAASVQLERATDREVRRWDLRPDDWHEIWPELVGAPGAPAVEARNAA